MPGIASKQVFWQREGNKQDLRRKETRGGKTGCKRIFISLTKHMKLVKWRSYRACGATLIFLKRSTEKSGTYRKSFPAVGRKTVYSASCEDRTRVTLMLTCRISAQMVGWLDQPIVDATPDEPLLWQLCVEASWRLCGSGQKSWSITSDCMREEKQQIRQMWSMHTLQHFSQTSLINDVTAD